MIAGRAKGPCLRRIRHNPEPGMLPKIMHAWHLAGRGPDGRLSEEGTDGTPETAAAVGAVPMPQQRAAGLGRKVTVSPQIEEVGDLAGRVCGHRDQTRLVKLGGPDEQRVLPGVVVPHRQPRQLAAPHAGGVEQHDRQPHRLGTQRRIARG